MFSAFSKSFCEIFGAAQPTEKELLEHFNLIKSNNGMAITHKLIRYISDRVANNDRWVSALQTKIPISFINGPKDPVSGIHMANRFKEVCPKQKLFILDDNVAHYPQLEAPEATMKAFFSFLSSL